EPTKGAPVSRRAIGGTASKRIGFGRSSTIRMGSGRHATSIPDGRVGGAPRLCFSTLLLWPSPGRRVTTGTVTKVLDQHAAISTGGADATQERLEVVNRAVQRVKARARG